MSGIAVPESWGERIVVLTSVCWRLSSHPFPSIATMLFFSRACHHTAALAVALLLSTVTCLPFDPPLITYLGSCSPRPGDK